MSEKKNNKKKHDDDHSNNKKKQTSEDPGQVVEQPAMNRGKPGTDERHKGQSPPPRNEDEDSTVLWKTTAQETNPDPQHGSASTAPRKSGVPAQPNSPPENADSDENEEEESGKEGKKKD